MATAELLLKIKPLLDSGKFDAAIKQIKDGLGKDIEIDPKGLSEVFDKGQKAAIQFNAEQKQALALLSMTGKKGTQEYRELQKQIQESASSVKKYQQALQDANKQPFNLKDMGAKFKSFATDSLKFAGGNLLASGISLVSEKIVEFGKQGLDFQSALADMSAITGVSGDALTAFGEKAKALSNEFGGTATDQITAFKGVLSRLGPDIAKSPEGLERMTKAINTLAKASGLDAGAAMDALTTAALQFNISLDDPIQAAGEMEKMMNVMAAGAKEGAAEIPQISEALVQSGTAAKNANITFEETNAAIQALATGGKYGSEAGVALRNVFGLLQKASGPAADALAEMGLSSEQLGETLTTKGLDDTLKILGNGLNKLGTDAERNAALTQIFGMENANAAAILIREADAVTNLTEKLTGTNTATEQAAINMNTLQERLGRAFAQIGNAGLGIFDQLTPVFNMLADTLATSVIPMITSLMQVLAPVLSSAGGILNSVLKPVADILALLASPLAKIFQLLDKLIQPLLKLIDPLLKPLMFVVEALVGALDVWLQILDPIITVIAQFVTAMVPLYEAFYSIYDALKPLIDIYFQAILSIFKLLFPQTKDMSSVMEGFAKAVKGVADWIKSMTEGLKNAIIGIGQFLGILDKTDKKAPLKKASTDTKKAAADIDKSLGDVVNANTNLETSNKKVTASHSNQKKEIESILTAYDRLSEQLDRQTRLYDLQQRKNIALAGREKNIIDEKDAYEQEQKVLQELQKEMDNLVKKYQLIESSTGEITIGAKLDEKNKADLINEYNKLKDQIAEADTREIEIKSKLDADNKEWQKRIDEINNEELALTVGIAVAADKTKLQQLEDELKLVADELETYYNAKEYYESFSTKTNADLQAIQELKAKIEESEKNQLEKQKEIIDEKEKLFEREQDLLEQANDKQIEEIKRATDEQLKIYDAFANAFLAATKTTADERLNKELDALTKQKDELIITEEQYNDRKIELEEKYRKQEEVRQAGFAASRTEYENNQAIQELAASKAKYQQLYEAAVKANDVIKQQEFLNTIGDIDKQIGEKSDNIMRLSTELQTTVTSIMSNLFTGNEEDIKQPFKLFFGVLAGALRTQMELLITKLVMTELEKLSFFKSGIGALLVLPLIKGVISGGLNALLAPALNSIASFATGGRVDEPTLAVVGDASKRRPGRDTEWILRDDQLGFIMDNAIQENNKQFAKYVALKELNAGLNDAIQASQDKLLQRLTNNLTFQKAQEVGMVNQFSSIKQLELMQTDMVSGINRMDRTLNKLYKLMKNKEFATYLNGAKVSKELQRERNRKRIYS